jgi:hypothetical protein
VPERSAKARPARIRWRSSPCARQTHHEAEAESRRNRAGGGGGDSEDSEGRRTDGVGTRERHDLGIVKAHAVEDVAQVCLRVSRARERVGASGVIERAGGTREVALGRALVRAGDVDAAVLHRDRRAAGLLDGGGGSELDDVRPREDRVGLLEALEVVDGLGQAGVGAVVDLWLEADGAVGAAAGGELRNLRPDTRGAARRTGRKQVREEAQERIGIGTCPAGSVGCATSAHTVGKRCVCGSGTRFGQ